MRRVVWLAVSVFVCLWGATVFAQAPPGPPPSGPPSPSASDAQWITQFAGAPQAVAVAGSDLYITGLRTAPDIPDVFVRKVSSDGNEQWTKLLGIGDASTRIPFIRIAADTSGVYVGATLVKGFQFNTLVRKYDATGAELWAAPIQNVLFIAGVAVDSSGVYATVATLNQPAFVRKYDTFGNELWTRQFGTSSVDFTMGIAADDLGIYVIWSETSLSALLANGTFTGSFVRKYDAAGNELWTRQFDEQTSKAAIGVAADNGGVSVASGSLFPGGLAALLGGGGSATGLIPEADVLLRRFDSQGNQLWTGEFGTPTFFGGIAADVSGIYVAGTVNGTLPGQTSEGPDAYVRKYDPMTGAAAWTRQFGTEASDSAAGVAVTPAGIYVAGSTGGSFSDVPDAPGSNGFLASFSLAPPPPPIDFVVAVAPTASTVTAGNTSSAIITVTPVTGSMQPVRFRAMFDPLVGATASFVPQTCTAPCSVTMTVSTSVQESDLPPPPVNVAVTVTGHAALVTKKTRFALTILPALSPLSASIHGPSDFCQPAINVGFNAVAVGGTPPWAFSWSASEGQIGIFGVGGGALITWSAPSTPTQETVTLRLLVIDSVGATASAEMVLHVHPLPVVSIAGVPATAIGLGTMVSLSANVVGGTPPFRFTWIRNRGVFASTQDITDTPPLGETFYQLIVTDANGCTSGQSFAAAHVFDYTINVAPGIQDVGIGRSATYTAAVNLVPGSTLFGLPGVSLSVSVGAQDSGIVGSVTPSFVALGPIPSTATVTIATGRSTPTGVVPISVGGLAGGAARGAALGLRVILEVQLGTFFADGDGNPLPVGLDGTPTVAAAIHQDGQISATNPGEVLAWGRLVNTGLVDITTVKLNDALPINWMPHPPWGPARGAIHVFVGSAPNDSTEIPWNTVSIGVTTGAPDRVAISIYIVAARGAPLAPGESVWVVVKSAYGLVGTIQSPQAFPIQYVNGVGADATAGPGQSGSYESQALLTVVARP